MTWKTESIVLAAVATVLTGCSPSAEPPVDAPSSMAGQSAAASEEAVVTQATEAVPVVLDAEGLSIGTGAKRRRFAFGSVQAEVERAIGDVTGKAAKLSSNEECGAGPMQFAQYGALTLNFQDGKLTGWFADEGDEAVTVDGIRPGVSLSDLQSERSVKRIADSTLEGEIEYAVPDGSTLGGFVSEGAEPRLTSLYAGMTCFFR